jgi:hypothetical protein
LPYPRLAGQLREQAGQVLAGVADPPPLAGDAQQVLGHRQAQQLSIIQLRLPAGQVIVRPAERGQYAVSQIHVECGQEGVQVVRHKTIFDALRLTFRAAARAKI